MAASLVTMILLLALIFSFFVSTVYAGLKQQEALNTYFPEAKSSFDIHENM